MKTVFTLFTLLVLLTASSCSKEDNDALSKAAVTNNARGSFEQFIEPIVAKDCASSGCHNAGGKLIQLAHSDQIIHAATNGAIGRQLFLTNKPNPCVNIDASSIKMLKVWVDAGSHIE